MMFNSPFTQTGAKFTRSLLKNKLTFNGIVTNLEKTVSTINQVLPIYNQVKPLISNSKTIISAFKNTSKKIIKPKRNNNIIDVNITKKEKGLQVPLNEPSKPFFL